MRFIIFPVWGKSNFLIQQERLTWDWESWETNTNESSSRWRIKHVQLQTSINMGKMRVGNQNFSYELTKNRIFAECNNSHLKFIYSYFCMGIKSNIAWQIVTEKDNVQTKARVDENGQTTSVGPLHMKCPSCSF